MKTHIRRSQAAWRSLIQHYRVGGRHAFYAHAEPTLHCATPPFIHLPLIYSYHPSHPPNPLNKHPVSQTDETLNVANPQPVDTGHVSRTRIMTVRRALRTASLQSMDWR